MSTIARLLFVLVAFGWGAAGIESGDPSTFRRIVAFVGAVVLYFFPTVEAKHRQHHQSTAIGLLNLFLGWTGIGWLIALIWAATKRTPQPAPVPAPSPAEWLSPRSGATFADPTDTRPCPMCAEPIKKAAIVCKHCGRDVPAAP